MIYAVCTKPLIDSWITSIRRFDAGQELTPAEKEALITLDRALTAFQSKMKEEQKQESE